MHFSSKKLHKAIVTKRFDEKKKLFVFFSSSTHLSKARTQHTLIRILCKFQWNSKLKHCFESETATTALDGDILKNVGRCCFVFASFELNATTACNQKYVCDKYMERSVTFLFVFWLRVLQKTNSGNKKSFFDKKIRNYCFSNQL